PGSDEPDLQLRRHRAERRRRAAADAAGSTGDLVDPGTGAAGGGGEAEDHWPQPSRRSPVRAVFFDWDGTLADTAEASYRCYVRMFADFGIAFDRDAYRRTYSPDWYHTFRCVGLPRERWADADERWLSYFAGETYVLLDGAHELLEELARREVMA